MSTGWDPAASTPAQRRALAYLTMSAAAVLADLPDAEIDRLHELAVRADAQLCRVLLVGTEVGLLPDPIRNPRDWDRLLKGAGLTDAFALLLIAEQRGTPVAELYEPYVARTLLAERERLFGRPSGAD